MYNVLLTYCPCMYSVCLLACGATYMYNNKAMKASADHKATMHSSILTKTYLKKTVHSSQYCMLSM